VSSNEEREYIFNKLIPELERRFEEWGAEYKQPRELGMVGEFVGLHRKVGKLKTIVWDRVDASGWREDPRTILQEVVAHGLLMLYDMDHGASFGPEPEKPELTYSDHVREMDEERERQRRAKHLSLPLKPDHMFGAVPHLAHPDVDCETWERLKANGD
jgi:hypothetical protein